MIQRDAPVEAPVLADAVEKQASAGYEHDGKGNFDGHQEAGEPHPACTGGKAAGAFLERAGDVDARAAERGQDAEDDCGRQRSKEREGQHAAVNCEFLDAIVGQQGADLGSAPCGGKRSQANAGHSSREGEERGFRRGTAGPSGLVRLRGRF